MQKSDLRNLSLARREPAPAPLHVAIIMDGNGRWATARGLARVAGHRRGAASVRRAVDQLVATLARELAAAPKTKVGQALPPANPSASFPPTASVAGKSPPE